MRKIYLLFVLIVFVGCEKDENVEPSTEEQKTLQNDKLQEISFKDLPSSVTKYFGDQNSIKSFGGKSSTFFGSVKTSVPAKKVTTKEGQISYTLVLNNNDNKASST